MRFTLTCDVNVWQQKYYLQKKKHSLKYYLSITKSNETLRLRRNRSHAVQSHPYSLLQT
ncbi:hypothetical protein Hdeb2414_s0012g00395231 [Helianthus debilis subsp. tardiflorus]